MTRIFLDRVSKSFEGDDGTTSVLSDLTMDISSPSFTVVIGPNGCGKTTLLSLMAGVEQPDSGSVSITVDHPGRPQVGYVWQDYRASLLPWLSVGENISYPLYLSGRGRRDRRGVATKVLNEFLPGIGVDQACYELSGGQQQLVSLLRSIVTTPDFLLFDEPLSALDQPSKWTIAFRIERIWMDQQVPAIFVSHDIDEAIMLADHIHLMGKRGGGIERTLLNELPRPRNVKMLTSNEHNRCRSEVIQFLTERGAIRDSATP
jgi:NitT/TauT family transport system ATP-binding protein